jgi:hypothetical protein
MDDIEKLRDECKRLAAKQLPSLNLLREMFTLDPSSPSHLRRRVTTSPKAQAGAIAGGLAAKGYYRVTIGGKAFPCHRIVWSLANGRLVAPGDEIDHINGQRGDNRPENLRSCRIGENHQNRALKPTTGTMWDGKGKWKACIYIDRRRIYLGSHEKREDAHAAYLRAKKTIHAFNPTPRELQQ